MQPIFGPYFLSVIYIICVDISLLKGQCHEIFYLLFFSWIEPIWAPDKQTKMVFLKKSLSRRYLNLKFKKFDYAQANTAWSQTFLTS